MKQETGNFAGVVLGIHLLILAALITGVFFASKEVYEQTRAQALQQSAHAQELLTSQTAQGIESVYASIHNDLDLIHRADFEEGGFTTKPATQPTAPATAPVPRSDMLIFGAPGLPLSGPLRALADVGAIGTTNRAENGIGNAVGTLLWKQLETRAKMLFVVDFNRFDVIRAMPLVRAIGPPGSQKEARKVVHEMQGWLHTVTVASVSSFQEIPDLGNGNVVCVPAPALRLGEKDRRMLVVFVPIDVIYQFLQKLNPADSTTAATLADEHLVTMVSSDPQLVGINAQRAEDPKVKQLTDQVMSSNQPATIYLEKPYSFGGVVRQPRMLTMVPVDVLGKHWFLMVSSRLSTVDDVVNRLFRRALYWAIFVVVAMTGVLVSTSVWLIRGRARLERVQHDVLTREMKQAREIQKAWLPQQNISSPLIDISAINEPASHISGDFYNWFELPEDRLAVIIGDVTGHGMSAAFLMATTQLLVRTTLTRVGDPGRCMEEVNRQLCTQIFVGQFVTMLIAVIDLRNQELQIATAGHYPPLLGNGDGFKALPMQPELVLGVDAKSVYRTEKYALPSGASLLMYTDGVLDVENPAGGRFGKESLRGSLEGKFDSAQTILDQVVGALDRFRARKEMPDDLTMVAIHLPASAARRPAPASAR
jgi:hypothetical protein